MSDLEQDLREYITGLKSQTRYRNAREIADELEEILDE